MSASTVTKPEPIPALSVDGREVSIRVYPSARDGSDTVILEVRNPRTRMSDLWVLTSRDGVRLSVLMRQAAETQVGGQS